jgi:hypothetical protein
MDDNRRMEAMTIRLVSLVERGGNVRARLRAEAPGIGVRLSLEVVFRAPVHSTRAERIREAYDRALAVLDPE